MSKAGATAVAIWGAGGLAARYVGHIEPAIVGALAGMAYLAIVPAVPPLSHAAKVAHVLASGFIAASLAVPVMHWLGLDPTVYGIATAAVLGFLGPLGAGSIAAILPNFVKRRLGGLDRE